MTAFEFYDQKVEIGRVLCYDLFFWSSFYQTTAGRSVCLAADFLQGTTLDRVNAFDFFTWLEGTPAL